MIKNITLIAILFLAFACNPSTEQTEETTTVEDSTQEEAASAESNVDSDGVFFGNIQDGATLSSPFTLDMVVRGMEVEPKGAPREGYGHHHLIVNEGAAPEGTVIVADATHIHYGGGQESTEVSLEPGDYKLTLQFADGMHVSYGEAWSRSINVVVE